MKKLISLHFICVCCFISSAQDNLFGSLPTKDGKVFFYGVEQADSISQNELYKRAKRWFVDSYKSSNDVIQLDDKENGEIIGKGNLETAWGATPIYVGHSIKIQVKDGRYKYEIKDFTVKYYFSGTQFQSGQNMDMTLEQWDQSFSGREKKRNEIYNNINLKMKLLIISLNKFLKTPPNEDW